MGPDDRPIRTAISSCPCDFLNKIRTFYYKTKHKSHTDPYEALVHNRRDIGWVSTRRRTQTRTVGYFQGTKPPPEPEAHRWESRWVDWDGNNCSQLNCRMNLHLLSCRLHNAALLVHAHTHKPTPQTLLKHPFNTALSTHTHKHTYPWHRLTLWRTPTHTTTLSTSVRLYWGHTASVD